MADLSENSFLTPGAVVTSLIGFFAGGISMAFNPLFATSVIAIVFAVLTLRSASRVRQYVVQGVLRILAVLGIMGGLAGIAVMLFPGLGVRS
jgi:predicted PurR-regulated permease PerM